MTDAYYNVTPEINSASVSQSSNVIPDSNLSSEVFAAPVEAMPAVETPVAAEQLNLFEEKLLTKDAVVEHKIIGQLFDTYWLVEFNEQLYIIDQHAAHERVLYEKTLHGMKDREFTSQYLSPPMVLNLSMQEEQILKEYIVE